MLHAPSTLGNILAQPSPALYAQDWIDSPPPFTPDIFWDTAKPGGVERSGSNVTKFVDLSGSGFDLLPAYPQLPVWELSSTPNRRPAIRWTQNGTIDAGFRTAPIPRSRPFNQFLVLRINVRAYGPYIADAADASGAFNQLVQWQEDKILCQGNGGPSVIQLVPIGKYFVFNVVWSAAGSVRINLGTDINVAFGGPSNFNGFSLGTLRSPINNQGAPSASIVYQGVFNSLMPLANRSEFVAWLMKRYSVPA